MSRPTARVYVDGFNLYRRCLSSRPEFKWLDVWSLATQLMPDHRVTHVDYFTARLRPGIQFDPQTPVRQQIYLRALRTRPDRVSIHYGRFRNDKRDMPIHPVELDPATGKWRTTPVKKLEEKGSDVNLASRMVADAFSRKADVFVLKELMQTSPDFVSHVTPGALARSQFPRELEDDTGRFHRPPAWG